MKSFTFKAIKRMSWASKSFRVDIFTRIIILTVTCRFTAIKWQFLKSTLGTIKFKCYITQIQIYSSTDINLIQSMCVQTPQESQSTAFEREVTPLPHTRHGCFGCLPFLRAPCSVESETIAGPGCEWTSWRFHGVKPLNKPCQQKKSDH